MLVLYTGEGNNILIECKSNILALSALTLMCVNSSGKYEALPKINASHCSLVFLFCCLLQVKAFQLATCQQA